MTTLSEDYAALKTGAAVAAVPRDVVSVAGPEALTYLQGQLSQNVEALAVGESAFSFVLQPHGKVDAFVRVTRQADESFLIDTDAAFGAAVVERLTRFKMRTKVTIELLQDWSMLSLRGSDAAALASTVATIDNVEVVSAAHWRGTEGVDLFGPKLAAPATLPTASLDAYEALRIEAGIPTMGAELDEKTIPAEAGINDLAIDFRKGCYTGQELVARIDARGNNVPRHLVGVVVESTEAPPRGAQLLPPGTGTAVKPWGVLTSTAFSPGFNSGVAIAYVRREVQAPCNAQLDWDDGMTPCRVLPFPMMPGVS